MIINQIFKSFSKKMCINCTVFPALLYINDNKYYFRFSSLNIMKVIISSLQPLCVQDVLPS